MRRKLLCASGVCKGWSVPKVKVKVLHGIVVNNGSAVSVRAQATFWRLRRNFAFLSENGSVERADIAET
jgi:hypothetical protein